MGLLPKFFSLICFLFLSLELLAGPSCPKILNPKYSEVKQSDMVRFEGKDYPDLIYDAFPHLEGSFMIRPKGNREENLKQTKKYVMLLHGVGADFSNPNSMLHQWGNYTGKVAGENKAGYGKRQILNHPHFKEGIYAEILPLIGSTFGGPDYQSLGKNIDILLKPFVNHIKEVRRLLPPDAEIIIHGRSYGASLAAALSHKYPKLVDKLILVGLATPEKSIVAEVEKVIREQEELGRQGLGERIDQDWNWTAWYTHLLSQVTWWNTEKLKDQAFGGAQALILVGARDFQVTETESILYADMALKTRNVRFHLIPGAEHDATKTRYDNNRLARMGVYGNSLALDFIWKSKE